MKLCFPCGGRPDVKGDVYAPSQVDKVTAERDSTSARHEQQDAYHTHPQPRAELPEVNQAEVLPVIDTVKEGLVQPVSPVQQEVLHAGPGSVRAATTPRSPVEVGSLGVVEDVDSLGGNAVPEDAVAPTAVAVRSPKATTSEEQDGLVAEAENSKGEQAKDVVEDAEAKGEVEEEEAQAVFEEDAVPDNEPMHFEQGELGEKPRLTRNSTLKAVYLEFARFGSRGTDIKTLDSMRFAKLCRECGLMRRGGADAISIDIIFVKCKAVKANRMTFSEFKTALVEVAKMLAISGEEVIDRIVSSQGPLANNITMPEYVRHHDNRGSYTGVYSRGGPTVSDGPKNLAQLVDRRASASMRITPRGSAHSGADAGVGAAFVSQSSIRAQGSARPSARALPTVDSI